MQDKQFTFVEAPIYQGQSHFGVSLGPAFIRQLLIDQNYDFQLRSPKLKQNGTQINWSAYEELSYAVEREYRLNNPVFTAGGDHSLAIGSILGALRAKPNLKVLWIDAHGDINTRETSLTGAVHGMPLAFLLGADRLEKAFWFEDYLKPENLIYFGVRDLDPAEKKFLDENKILYFTNKDANSVQSLSLTMKTIVEECRGEDVHISLDADAFDPTIAFSTGVKVSEGLAYEQVAGLVKAVSKSANVRSMDFVELNPQIFNSTNEVFKTAQIGIDIFNIILENLKNKEGEYGLSGRKRYSEEPNLLHTLN